MRIRASSWRSHSPHNGKQQIRRKGLINLSASAAFRLPTTDIPDNASRRTLFITGVGYRMSKWVRDDDKTSFQDMRARQLARFSLGQRSNPCGLNIGGRLHARTQPRVSNRLPSHQRKRHFTRPNRQTVIGFLVNGRTIADFC